jgi:uncharacterized protein (TIGR02302 family)
MSDATNMQDATDHARRYALPPDLLLALARAVVLWERLWPALWPAAGVAAGFLAVAWLDLLPLLPVWLHGAALATFAAAFGFLLHRGLRRFRAVDRDAARHRLERDSGLAHRPLTALEDRLAGGADDKAARALWHAHLLRAAAAARRLHLSLPSPGLARHDPWALRAAAALVFAIGLVAGWGEMGARLQRALIPPLGAAAAPHLALDIWITPPAYTRRAPVFLKRVAGDETRGTGEGADEPVVVPAGSAILAQASGLRRAPRLRVGDQVSEFTALAGPATAGPEHGGTFRAEAIIEQGDRLAVELGGDMVASWPLEVVPDQPPTVEFTAAPARTARAHLSIDYEANDDYGLAGVDAIIRHPEGRPVPGGEAEVRLNLRLSGIGSEQAKGSSLHDLSAHPWAGVEVRIQLEATDGRGQTGASDVITMVLPERIFNHPVARAIAEQRKRLTAATPEVREEVAAALDDLARRPHHFAHDTVVYLALRHAQARLRHDGSDAAVGSVQKILWETALRIEDGKFAVAERDLREIQERLMRALKESQRGASKEVERLLDQLREALDKFLSALQEHMEQQGLQDVTPFDPENMRLVDSLDLHRMIEEARELARSGAIDAARRMLAELQRMLGALQQGMMAGPMRPEAQQARRMMDGLRELSRRQQQLLDRTFRRLRENQGAMPGAPGQERDRQGQPGRGDERSFDDAGAQNALRRMLGELMRQLGEMMGDIPAPLGKAERAMRDAEGALGDGEPGRAVPSQTEALNQLRQGIEGLGEKMARRFGGMPGMVGEMPGGSRQPNRDPFGRQSGGAYGTSIDGDVKVPDRMERQRAREILQELRRRAGERDRPILERDYIDRLLRQF